MESKRKISIQHCNDVMIKGDKVIKVTRRTYEIYMCINYYLDIIYYYMIKICTYGLDIKYSILSLIMKEKIVDTF